MLVFEERGKTGLHDGGKLLRAKMRTNNKLNPHMASTPRFASGKIGGMRVLPSLYHPCLP